MKKEKMFQGIIICCIGIIMISYAIATTPPTHADSGYDTDYDIDYNIDHSNSYDDSTSDGSTREITVPLILFMWVLTIAIYMIKTGNHHYGDSKFISERFDDFCKIQDAWMNFDYNTLRKYVTDELYNQYEMQLEILKENNEKNIMENYRLIHGEIRDIYETSNKIIAQIEMEIIFFDYIEKDREIIRGTDTRKVDNVYILEYVYQIEEEKKCPSCGGKLKKQSKCPYCGCQIITGTGSWLLSKKRCLSSTLYGVEKDE